MGQLSKHWDRCFLSLEPLSNSTLQLARLFAGLFFLLLAVTLFSARSNGEANPSAQQLPGKIQTTRPNIVLLLFDDAGYSDMSAFGGEIQTPNVERIAREGITVRRFYNAARCSPTRAGILSGHYPHDVGMADLAGPSYKTDFSAYQGQLPLEIPLISELLQTAGYRTYLQGKWHLGSVPGMQTGAALEPAPNVRGFDEFFGFLGGMAAPYPPVWHRPYQHNQHAIEFEEGWFSIAGLNDKMMQRLKLQFQTEPETPFFVYFASQSPHGPLQAPEVLIEKYRKIYKKPLEDIWNDRVSRMRQMGLFPPGSPAKIPLFSGKDVDVLRATAATRAAMIEATDTAFGKLLQLLEESGKLENTLIIVASDNGGTTTTYKLSNAPYRGAKASLYEGGVLSPLVARWPAGGLKVNGMTDEVTTYLDLMPTFLHATGVAYPPRWHTDTPLSPLEGRNLLPVFRGEKISPPEYFYWNLHGSSAVLHNGRWKLLTNSGYDEKREQSQAEPVLELYDLLSDPTESINLAGKEKDIAARLLANYQTWARQHGAVPYYQVLDAYKKNGAGRDQSTKDQ